MPEDENCREASTGSTNVVVLDDQYARARVHVREMGMGYQFGRTHREAFGVDGAVAVAWKPPTDAMGRPIDPAAQADAEAFDAAEAALRAGDGDAALLALQDAERSTDSYARRLYLRAALVAARWDRVVDTIALPENADELVVLIRALEALKKTGAARETLARNAGRLGLADQVRRDIEDRLDVQEMIGK